jgi:hypothetical protein
MMNISSCNDVTFVPSEFVAKMPRTNSVITRCLLARNHTDPGGLLKYEKNALESEKTLFLSSFCIVIIFGIYESLSVTFQTLSIMNLN